MVIVRCSPYLCDLIYPVSPVHSIVSQVAVVTSLGTAWDINHCAFVQGSLIQRAFGLRRASGRIQCSSGTVNIQCSSRIDLTMFQQKSSEKEYTGK